MNIDEINKNLRKMRRNVIFMENHVKNFFELNQHYNQSKINPIFVRNVVYVNNIVQAVKDNILYINTLDRSNRENRFIIKKKFIISLILLKHINEITTKHSFEDVDYEVENILYKKDQLPSFMDMVPKIYQKSVYEEFNFLIQQDTVLLLKQPCNHFQLLLLLVCIFYPEYLLQQKRL